MLYRLAEEIISNTFCLHRRSSDLKRTDRRHRRCTIVDVARHDSTGKKSKKI
jgi:hypothetical protein